MLLRANKTEIKLRQNYNDVVLFQFYFTCAKLGADPAGALSVSDSPTDSCSKRSPVCCRMLEYDYSTYTHCRCRVHEHVAVRFAERAYMVLHLCA